MKVSQRLLNKALPYWERTYDHPFVQGIRNGDLPVEKFRFYMLQDHKYLLEYTKVFAAGMIKAKTEENIMLFAGLIASMLFVEDETHLEYLEKMGISKEEIAQTERARACKAYSDYELSVAMEGDLAEIATVAMACSWSYQMIGDYILTKEDSVDDPFYGPWIKAYQDEIYRKSNDTIIDLVDKFSEGYTEAQIQKLEEIIVDCSLYEERFWDMAWNME